MQHIVSDMRLLFEGRCSVQLSYRGILAPYRGQVLTATLAAILLLVQLAALLTSLGTRTIALTGLLLSATVVSLLLHLFYHIV